MHADQNVDLIDWDDLPEDSQVIFVAPVNWQTIKLLSKPVEFLSKAFTDPF